MTRFPKFLREAFTLLAFVAAAAHGASVRVADGNVVYVDDSGIAKRLTSSGLDSAPGLSYDNGLVAFVRRTPGRVVAAGAGDVEAGQLWVIRTNGSGARLLVDGHDSKDPRGVLAELASPVFSPDGHSIYFRSEAWATSGAIHAVDLKDGKERFVTDGNSLAVVGAGMYAGALIVSKHKYWLAGGSYDWLWLVSQTGKEIGPVGPEDVDIDAFERQFAK
jgi:hypothetical protein